MYKDINWLDDMTHAKARSQFKMNVMAAMKVFDIYGQGVYIPVVAEIITRLAEQYGLRVRGVDIPISLDVVKDKIKKT